MSSSAVQTESGSGSAVGRRRFVLLITAVLYLYGLVMITSATSGTGLLQDGDPWSYFRRQLLWGALGIICLLVAMKVRLSFVQRMAWPFVLLSTGMCLLLFVPGLGMEVKGATRWLSFGPLQMQPSELVKIAVAVYLADHLSRTAPPLHWLRDFIKSPGGVGIGLAALIFIQRDLGTAMIVGATVLVLYVLAGTNWRLLASTVGPGLLLIVIGIASEPYRRERFLAFLDPWANPTEGGYQLVQALIAIGSGGLFGVGLGHSVEKMFYLPEAHTDMIYSIVAEELGLVGVAVILVSYMGLALVGLRIAATAPTRFQQLLAAALTATLVGQAMLNIGGVVGLLPLTGVPLPLVSYGGSSLLVAMTSLGLLANIAVASPASRSARAATPAAKPLARAGSGRRNSGTPGARTGRGGVPA